MRPEEVIRHYLDAHGGSVEAHLDHLLVSFKVEEPTPEARADIARALAGVGVRPEPPLGDVGPDGLLSLRVTDDEAAIAPSDPGPPAGPVRRLSGLFAGNGKRDRVDEPSPPVVDAPVAESVRRDQAELHAQLEGSRRDADARIAELEERARHSEERHQGELDGARTAHQELAQALEEAQAETGRVSAELTETQERAAGAEAERERLAQREASLRQGRDELERSRTELSERHDALAGELEAARAEAATSARALESAVQSEARLRRELEQARGEAQRRLDGSRREHEEAVGRHQAELEALRSERDDALTSLAAAKSELEEGQSQVAAARDEASAAGERLEDVRSDLERERERSRSLAERLEELERKQGQLGEELERRQVEQETAKRRLGEALVAVLERRGPVDSAREEFEAARVEHDRLSAVLMEAEGELEEAETKAAEIAGRALEKRTRRAELERVLRALHNSKREAEEAAGRQRDKLGQLGPRLELARTEASRLAERAADCERRLAAARERAGEWSEDGTGKGPDEHELRELKEAEVGTRRDAEVGQAEASRLEAAVADARSRLAAIEETAAEKSAELDHQSSELARLEAKGPDGVRRTERYEPPKEQRARVDLLRADLQGALAGMEEQRGRLDEAEQQLRDAQEALEDEVAREARSRSSRPSPTGLAKP
ncbi:MAG: hypothetical protein ABR581_06565 [Thermoleophilaceae bacterium]